MSGDKLNRLLGGQYRDPDGGALIDAPATVVVIAESLAGLEADLVGSAGLDGALAMVSDPATHAVLGARVERALGPKQSIVLDDRPRADMATVQKLRAATAGADALIAVGSGTINDLCKYAGALDGKPYAVFATAPSMNGYTSLNAAITEHGHKKSLPGQAAAGVFMELAVLAAAPARMIRSGLGDSICRPTAQADWLLAHLLLGQPYREAPFDLLAEDEAALLADPEALMSGDLDAMQRLARTLSLSGFGMTICGGSYPASQGEHLIGHYAEMRGDPSWPDSFHGEQIAVATLTMARLQEGMLDGPPPRLRVDETSEADLVARFGAETGRSCWRLYDRKRLTADRAEQLNARLERDWEAIRARIRDIAIPAEALADVLRRAGAPTEPGDIGWPEDFYRKAVRHAREIRDRYTFLDLAADAGMFDDETFAV